MDLQEIHEFFSPVRTIAVLGMSANPGRASYQVAQYMQQQGHLIVPVNPVYAGQNLLGCKCLPDLVSAAQVQQIDVVNCFRRADDLMQDLEAMLQVQAKMIWLQLGIINTELAEIAQNKGIVVVMDKCLKIEHDLAFQA